MTILLICTLLIFIVVQFLGSYSKKNIPEFFLVEYHKKIRPKFIRVYYLSLIPLLAVVGSLLTNNLQFVASYKIPLTIFVLVINIVSIVIVVKAYNLAENSQYFRKLKTTTVFLFISKALLVISLIFYISKLLNSNQLP